MRENNAPERVPSVSPVMRRLPTKEWCSGWTGGAIEFPAVSGTAATNAERPTTY
jgi:hypothetical protein